MNNDQGIIVGAMALTVVSASINNLKSSSNRAPTPKIIFGGLIGTIILLMISEEAPRLAATFAVLIATSEVIGHSDGLVSVLNKLTTAKPKAPVLVS